MIFWVYILRCANGQYYVGSTDNLALRLREHKTGTDGALFSKAHRPVTLVYTQEFATREEAYAREKQIKGWSHAKKDALISGDYNRLSQLSKTHGTSRNLS